MNDVSELGDKWVNTVLDLQLAVDSCPDTYPYSILYAWAVKKDDDTIVGINYKGENDDGLAYAFYKLFGSNVEMIPIILTAVSKFVENQKDKRKKDKYMDAIKQILNIDEDIEA